nr:PD40 domain-containing protein [Gemmatimonadales bacterium]
MCRAALLALAPSALALTISLALSPVPAAAPDPGLRTHLARFADIHGDSIVFTYEGDLWLVPAQAGDAHRITSDPGEERFAKFSPDGTRIAFTANYDGGTDVYVMDARGGAAVRLTYHPAPDLVVDWYPDGKSILFRTRREYPYRGEQLYRVPADAGMEQKLPLDRGGLASLSPDGGSLAYCRLSNENATWKRHKGGDAQDIWVGSLERGDFRRITDWEGIDNYPMWQGDAIYFSSDREHGTANLFRYDVRGGQTTALTHSADYDVKYPSLGPGAIVFQSAETLHVLDLQSGKVRDVEVRIPTDAVAMRPEYVEPLDYAHGFDLSPDGARVVLEVRGEIVSVPAESDKKLATYNLTRTSGSHDKDPAVSPDGKHVAFISDRSGEEEIYLAAADGTGAWRQLTSGNKGFRFRPVWSPDGKYLLFGDKSMKLNLVDVAAGRLSVLDQGEYDDGWDRYGIQDYVFSPDGKFIAYTKKLENTNEVVLLYSLASKTATPVTDDEFQSWSPSFDPRGRYLYFLSNRSFSPVMGAVDQDHVFLDMARPYLVLLKADEPDPFGPQPAVAAEPAKDEGQANKKKDAPPEQPVAVRIDLDGIGRRVLAVPGIE